jgi:hypothetical protein
MAIALQVAGNDRPRIRTMLFFDQPSDRPIPPAAAPSLALVAALAPDPHEASLVARRAGLPDPLDTLTTDDADADTAAHIAETLPPETPDRRQRLEALRRGLLTKALDAARKAHLAHHHHRLARDNALRLAAEAPASADAHHAQETATLAFEAAAEATVAAAVARARAFGADRAIQLALDHQPWTPRDHHREADELFGLTGPNTPG